MGTTHDVRQRPLATTMTGWAFLTAAGWLFAAWVVMWPMHGHEGPGLGWTVGHLAWIVGFLALGLVSRELYRRVPRADSRTRLWATAAHGVTLFGLVTGIGQMVVDLTAGFQTSSYAALQDRSDEITSGPGVDLVLYTLGPPLFFLGLCASFALLARTRQTSWLNPPLVLLSFVTIGIDEDLTPIGLALMFLALAPIGRGLLTRRTAVAQPGRG